MNSLDHFFREIISIVSGLVRTHSHWNGDISQEDALHKLRLLLDALDNPVTDATPDEVSQ